MDCTLHSFKNYLSTEIQKNLWGLVNYLLSIYWDRKASVKGMVLRASLQHLCKEQLLPTGVIYKSRQQYPHKKQISKTIPTLNVLSFFEIEMIKQQQC